MKSFERALDDDGRFLVPEQIRDEYRTGVIFNLGFGVYLHCQNDEAWLEFRDAFSRAHILDESTANIAVRMISSQQRMVIDEQGRVQIPARLRELAAIKRNIIGTPVEGKVAYYRIIAKELAGSLTPVNNFDVTMSRNEGNTLNQK